MTPALVSSSTAPIHLPSINYIAILPALVLLGGAVVVLAASSLVRGGLRRNVATALTLLSSLAAWGARTCWPIRQWRTA